MKEFVNMYAADPKEAKRFYYNSKVHFDVAED